MAKFDYNIADKPQLVISYAISNVIGHGFNSDTKYNIDMLHLCFLISDELSFIHSTWTKEKKKKNE